MLRGCIAQCASISSSDASFLGTILKYSNKIVYDKDGDDGEVSLLYVYARSEPIDCKSFQIPGQRSLLSCCTIRDSGLALVRLPVT
jgi:hypothetical protein